MVQADRTGAQVSSSLGTQPLKQGVQTRAGSGVGTRLYAQHQETWGQGEKVEAGA